MYIWRYARRGRRVPVHYLRRYLKPEYRSGNIVSYARAASRIQWPVTLNIVSSFPRQKVARRANPSIIAKLTSAINSAKVVAMNQDDSFDLIQIKLRRLQDPSTAISLIQSSISCSCILQTPGNILSLCSFRGTPAWAWLSLDSRTR